ncbi:MAG: PP2C family serine/threonine-protein phosphatase, partial [Myxococcota bacterium]
MSDQGRKDDDTVGHGMRRRSKEVTATTPEVPSAKLDAESTEVDAPGLGVTDTDSDVPAADGRRSGELFFRYYGITDVGLVREHNEDNFIAFDVARDGGLYRAGGTPGDGSEKAEEVRESALGRSLILAVCDGMGGAAAGEVASQMAVDTVLEVMAAPTKVTDRDAFAHRLVYAIEDAGSRIFGAAKMDRSRRGMGTTATVAGLVDETLFVGQVGDSRCYVLRNGELGQVTKDQSLVNQLIEAGQLTEEEAEAFEHSNIILQALGTTEEVSVDLTFLELRRGDRILLCSDGLSGMVHGETIRDALAQGDDLEAIAHRLVHLANEGGGHDNISCVVADVDGPFLRAHDGAPEVGYAQYPLPPARPDIQEELPRREPTAPKPGGKKPGADVKPQAVVQERAGDPTVPTQSFPWWILAILVAVAVVALVLVVGAEDEEPPPPPETPPAVEERSEAPATVRVRVTSNARGRLLVDGEAEAT